MNRLNIRDLGLVSYSEAYQIQNEIYTDLQFAKKEERKTSGTVLFCEHPHVYTIGKSGNRKNLLIDNKQLEKLNAEFFPVDRGGDITYHGPGQIVMYPIIDLDNYGMGVKEYIYMLEYLIIDVLNSYGLKGEISSGNIGVWLDVGKNSERKICSVGVKTGRKITMHGIALNVNTDLSYFSYINPCGFTQKSMTSIEKEIGENINIENVKELIKTKFVEVLIKNRKK